MYLLYVTVNIVVKRNILHTMYNLKLIMRTLTRHAAHTYPPMEDKCAQV